MITNLDRYKKDLEKLEDFGDLLLMSLKCWADEDAVDKQVKKAKGEKVAENLKKLPPFREEYQSWYSEARALIKQLLPDRLADFVRHYEKPKSRKAIDITFENYRIEDALQGLQLSRGQGYQKEIIASIGAAVPHFEQQLAILRSVKGRFESSLFDIQQLVQADLFDSELDAASALLKQKFTRAAGAMSGVVLERHLAQVCDKHNIKIAKKDPSIADLNDALKANGVIDLVQWRNIQFLGDIRNLCDHNKKDEPTVEQVNDLILGVTKVIKTIF